MHVHKNKAGKKEEMAEKRKGRTERGLLLLRAPPSLFPDRTVKEKREKNMTNKRA